MFVEFLHHMQIFLVFLNGLSLFSGLKVIAVIVFVSLEMLATTNIFCFVCMFRLVFNDSNALKICQYVYYPENKISLARKEKIAQSWTE